jgi:hypothetical protein
MLTPKLRLLHQTGLTDLVRTDPFSLDRPPAATLVIWIVAGEMAIFDQAPAGVVAEEMDDFELLYCELPQQGPLLGGGLLT